MRLCAAVLVIVFASLPLQAQAQFPTANHPELAWQVIETDHFKVYYDRGLERPARRAAGIAEGVFGPITSLYGFTPPEKVRIILKDTDDFANGAALYFHNTLEIWLTNLAQDFELRGTSDWLRNVIAHEFTHVISLQVAQKAPRRVPAFYFHYLGYQQEQNRKDILRGFPDAIASYAVPSVICPPWFAEGTAQVQAAGARYDRWDSHRDMILRTATLHNRLLTYDEMGAFEKDGLGNEKVYDHGYALTLFIARQFGEDRLAKLMRGMSSKGRFTFSASVRKALGISGKELHRRWKADLEARYRAVADSINARRIDGDSLRSEGYLNMAPRWSPDGRQIAYLSNQGGDYGRMRLFVVARKDSATDRQSVADRQVAGGGVTGAAWSPDGRRIVLSKRSEPDRNGSRLWDLYEIAATDSQAEGRGESRRLTRGLRATQPSISPDGTRIAFIKNGGGDANLCVCWSDGSGARPLTDLRDGGQVYAPRWSPDGRQIVFSFSTGDRRDIGAVSADGGPIETLIASDGTDRDPCWSPDGRQVLFSSDVTGIYNLYALDLTDGTISQVTNVLGGAFSPDVNPKDGRVAFSHYGRGGYEVRVLPDARPWRAVDPALFRRSGPAPDRAAGADSSLLKDNSSGDASSRRSGHDSTAAETPSTLQPGEKGGEARTRPYRSELSALILLPRLAVDDGVVKVGSFLASDDVLGKQSLFAGVLLARNFDLDLFGIFELRRFRPTFFLEYYRQVRHDDEQIVNRDEDYRLYERIFALSEIGAGLRREVKGGTASGSLAYSRYNTTLEQSSFNRIDVPRGRISANYLSGLDVALSYHLQAVPPRRDSEVNPRGGREVFARYDRYFNYFLSGFRQDASIVQEIYDKFFYDQLTLDWREYLPLPRRSTLALRLFGGLIDRRIDPFFAFRAGGLPGMKGYTYYSLEGSRAATLNVTYRSPLLTGIARQVGPLYLDKVYGAVYADVGRAWYGDSMDRILKRGVKRDIGAQLRFDAVSFHIFPTRVSLDAAYGLDTVPLQQAGDPEERSGWKVYFTLLFGYL